MSIVKIYLSIYLNRLTETNLRFILFRIFAFRIQNNLLLRNSLRIGKHFFLYASALFIKNVLLIKNRKKKYIYIYT